MTSAHRFFGNNGARPSYAALPMHPTNDSLTLERAA